MFNIDRAQYSLETTEKQNRYSLLHETSFLR